MGLTSFFFGSGYTELKIWNQVVEVVNWWDPIVRTAKDAPRGAGYLLPLRGKREPRLFYDPR